jgi:hypothetical protein
VRRCRDQGDGERVFASTVSLSARLLRFASRRSSSATRSLEIGDVLKVAAPISRSHVYRIIPLPNVAFTPSVLARAVSRPSSARPTPGWHRAAYVLSGNVRRNWPE